MATRNLAVFFASSHGCPHISSYEYLTSEQRIMTVQTVYSVSVVIA